MSTRILTTMNTYNDISFVPGSNIIDPTKNTNGVKEYQTVVAIGFSVRNVKIGDIVCINPSNYAVHKYAKNSMKADMDENYNRIIKYNFNVIEINKVSHLLLDEADIDFIVLESTNN